MVFFLVRDASSFLLVVLVFKEVYQKLPTLEVMSQLGFSRWASISQNLNGWSQVAMSTVHGCPWDIDLSYFINCFKRYLGCFVQDQVCIFQWSFRFLILIGQRVQVLIEACKAHPQLRKLAKCICWVDGLNRLGVGLRYYAWIFILCLKYGYPFHPLLHIIGVFRKHHVAQKIWPSLQQAFYPEELEFLYVWRFELLCILQVDVVLNCKEASLKLEIWIINDCKIANGLNPVGFSV